jgi:exopolysaccharide biosynthesis polyprenyl glycosylphosphotransferase
MLVYWALLSIGLVWLTRVVLDALLREAHRRGRDLERVLIVGDGEQAQLVEAKIRSAPELGYRIAGFIGNGSPAARVQPVLGGLGSIPEIVREQAIGEVIIAWAGISHQQLIDIVTGCTRQRVDIKIFPDIFELMAREVETSELTGLPLMRVRDVALRGWMRFLKRALDVAVSWTLLVFLSPWLLLMALLVKLTSPHGPILYVQERVGLDGRPFYMLKFRSMRPDAEAESGPVWTVPNDPRRTRLGEIIRRFSLDEFPQLINVLLGEMSLVGPRPERPEFVAQFANLVPRYRERHMEKAGMTGWAQVNGLRGQTSIVERTEYDLFYVETWSLAFDVKILIKTLAAVIRDRNAY